MVEQRSIRTTASVVEEVEEVEEVCTDPAITRQMTAIAGCINALEMFFLGVLHHDLGYSQRISLIEQAVGLSSSHPPLDMLRLDVLETLRQRIHFLERCFTLDPPGTRALFILDFLDQQLMELEDGIQVGISIVDRIENVEHVCWGARQSNGHRQEKAGANGSRSG